MIIAGLSGSLGPNHYARVTRDGRTIICSKPDFSNRQFSQSQRKQQSRMQLAAAYARTASKENPIYAQKAKGTAKNAYNVALADWFHPPVIFRLEQDEGTLQIYAYDDVLVQGVAVTLLDKQGQCLEQGQAELIRNAWWEYPARSAERVLVEARDLADNVTRQEFYAPSVLRRFLEKVK